MLKKKTRTSAGNKNRSGKTKVSLNGNHRTTKNMDEVYRNGSTGSVKAAGRVIEVGEGLEGQDPKSMTTKVLSERYIAFRNECVKKGDKTDIASIPQYYRDLGMEYWKRFMQYDVVWQDLSSLIPADFNPAKRIKRGRRLSKLAYNILINGPLHAIDVEGKNRIMDGGRRREAAGAGYLNWAEYPTRKLSNISLEQFFVDSNSHRQSINGNDWLGVYVKRPKAVPAEIRAGLAGWEKIVGKTYMKHMVTLGKSVGVFDCAASCAIMTASFFSTPRNNGVPTKSTIKKIVHWIVEQNIPHHPLKRDIQQRSITSAKLANHIMKNTSPTFRKRRVAARNRK